MLVCERKIKLSNQLLVQIFVFQDEAPKSVIITYDSLFYDYAAAVRSMEVSTPLTENNI